MEPETDMNKLARKLELELGVSDCKEFRDIA